MTEQKAKAAELIAAGKLTIPQIAEQIGITKRTVFLWKKDKEFHAEVKRAASAWRQKARTVGVADPDWRLRHINDRYKRLRGIIEQRAKDPQMKDVPGGRTGLLTVTYKMQSKGEGLGSTAVPEYSVDKSLLDAMLEIEEHVAIAKGQWKQKVEHSGELAMGLLMERLNAGRKRAAQERVQREAACPQL